MASAALGVAALHWAIAADEPFQDCAAQWQELYQAH